MSRASRSGAGAGAAALSHGLWLGRRVARMPPAELPWRAGKAWLTRRRRRQFRAETGVAEAAARLAPPALAAGPRDAARLAGWPLPESGAGAEGRIARLREGAWEVFGHAVPIEPPSPEVWHRDPESGRSWSRGFGPAIALRGENVPGEYRAIWEVNRLAFCYLLVHPAAPWPLSDGVARCRRIVGSWAAANPVYRGINWSSAMEAAIRVLHLVWTVAGVARRDESEARRLLRDWWPLLCVHAGFVRDRISLYSSANNHLILELAALLTFAEVTAPAPVSVPDADSGDAGPNRAAIGWRRELARQIERQFDGNGVNREHSSGYQRFVLQALGALAGTGATAHDPALESRLRSVLRFGRRFLAALEHGGGERFEFGDWDDGLLFGDPPRAAVDHPATATVAAANREAGAGTEVDADAADHAGYLVGRSGGWSVLLDVAEDGLPPLYGHAHSDTLALQVRAGRRLLLGDPGTYSYAGGEAARLGLRLRRAHSVFGPASWEPFRVHGPFLASPAPGVRERAAETRAGWTWLWGRHGCHPDWWLERAVLVAPSPGCVLVLDRATPTGRGPTAAGEWVLRLRPAPGWSAGEATDGAWTLDDHGTGLRAYARVAAPVPLRAETTLGEYSPAFRRLVRAPVLSATCAARPEALLTCLHDSEARLAVRWEPARCVVDLGGRGAAPASVEFRHDPDTVIACTARAGDGEPVEFSGCAVSRQASRSRSR